jgi:hypothetical protein
MGGTMDELTPPPVEESTDSRSRSSHRLELLIDVSCMAIAPTTLMVVRFVQFWSYSVDDAFILLRYGRNLAQGHGLTFNTGLPAVEGYSNLLYVILAAIAETIGLNSLLLLKLIGLTAALLTPAAVWWLALKAGCQKLVARIAALAVALAPSYCFWAVSGLETSLAALILTLALTLGFNRAPGSDFAAALLLFLLSIIRPEGPVFGVVLILAILVVDRFENRHNKFTMPRFLRLAVFFAAVYTVYFCARWVYFGALLPNPIYFKTMAGESSWRDSMAVDYIVSWWPVLAAAVLCLRFPGNNRLRAIVALVFSGILVYGRSQHYVVGGVGTMAFFGRYFLHLFPLLTVAAAALIGHAWVRSRSLPFKMGTASLAIALGAWTFVGPDGTADDMREAALARKYEVPTRIAAVADYVNSRYGAEAVVAVGDIGRNGYAIKGDIHDIFGLTSYDFTLRFERDLDSYVDWIIEQRPTCILILAELVPGGFKPTYYPEARILANPVVRKHYRVGQRLGFQPGSAYFYMVLEQREQLAARGETGDAWWTVSEMSSQ